MTDSATEAGGAGSPVEELLRRRDQLHDWLRRLDDAGDEVSPRVVERVRADYQERLRAVLDELAGHRAALQDELERQRELLHDADTRYGLAADQLAEQTLRWRIGEIEEGDWEGRRADLEMAVAAAERERENARAEVARLENIVAQVRVEPAAAPEPAEEEEGTVLAVEPVAAEADPGTWELPPAPREPDYWSGANIPPIPTRESETPVHDESPENETEDIGFLEELDRAIASSGPAETPPRLGHPVWDDEGPAAPPAKGVKCPECGYTNDASAWYCGVCGADLS